MMEAPNPFAQAIQLRGEQRTEEALALLRAIARTYPGDARGAFAFAQLSFECWRPAAELFAAARRLAPDQPDLVRNHALALAAEGEVDVADAMLDAMLAQHPLWLDGHRTLASLRITQGQGESADASYARACAAVPDNGGLRLAWFYQHAIGKGWAKAEEVLGGASPELAASDGFQMARLFLRSESCDPSLTDGDFAPFAERGDPGFDLCRMRFHLRHGEAAKAEAIAMRQVGGVAARNFWPYLSLCWRLMDDPRAGWLDGEPLFAQAIDLDIPPAELSELAQALRNLHRMKAPYPEQSVRGGTQTDRQLFFHPDPAIQKIRQRVTAAVEAYAATLPTPVAGHPLLGHARQPIHFEGSWSVRLAGGGFHASHTHNLGWISSALYLALPDDMGPEPDGWLSLGKPPPELGLDLAPYDQIEPKPGRLALFPSTLWHATEPFGEGERLTIAFDIAIPPLISA
jgi:tetratricopeptide (TPR) repeat protein